MQTTLNVNFKWYDSFTRQTVNTQSAQLAAISCLYNFAVCLARRGCYMDLAGDGIKQASNLFRQAAWIFEQLLSMSSQLPPETHSTDFNKETLTMNSNLCLAQAQYLFFKKASDAGMAAGVLAKIAAQVAIYFEKAFESNQVNQALRNFDNSRFANVLGYHSKYFSAMAYWSLGKKQFEDAGSQGRGMNLAVAYLTVCVEKFTEARRYAEACGGNYMSNFSNKYAEA